MQKNKLKFFTAQGLPDNTILTVENISALSGFPLDALQLVYNRGVIHDNTKKISEKKKHNDGIARVYSFIMKDDKIYYGIDNDIREYYGLV